MTKAIIKWKNILFFCFLLDSVIITKKEDSFVIGSFK